MPQARLLRTLQKLETEITEEGLKDQQIQRHGTATSHFLLLRSGSVLVKSLVSSVKPIKNSKKTKVANEGVVMVVVKKWIKAANQKGKFVATVMRDCSDDANAVPQPGHQNMRTENERTSHQWQNVGENQFNWVRVFCCWTERSLKLVMNFVNVRIDWPVMQGTVAVVEKNFFD